MTNETNAARCSQSVRFDGWGRPSGQCSRKGIMEHDGELFCTQHSPEGKARRDGAADTRRKAGKNRLKAQMEQQQRRHEIVALVLEATNLPPELQRAAQAYRDSGRELDELSG